MAGGGIFGSDLSVFCPGGDETNPGTALGSLIAPITRSLGSSRPNSIPAETTVFTSSLSGSLRPGLNTRKKIAWFARFISSKTTARSGGTVRVLGVPTVAVFGEYHRLTCVVLWFSRADGESVLAERRAAP